MPGQLMWGWYPAGNKWVKLKVDEDGSIHIVGYVDSLDDIGDVELAGIADDDILYWDATAGDWLPIAHLGVADAHHAKYTNGEAVSAVEAAGLALASGKNIKVISALTASHTWSGLTAVLTAGTALTIGQAVYVGGDSKMELADKDLATTMPAIALCTPETLANNAAGEFLMQGFFRDDTWNWTIGGILYVGDDGALTQDVSGYTTGDQVQVVGIAITADIIHFNPSYELVKVS